MCEKTKSSEIHNEQTLETVAGGKKRRLRLDDYIHIDERRCIGCGRCMMVCPADALHIIHNVAHVDVSSCVFCAACEDACPTDAIDVA